jgi:hypothetical protein
MVLSERLFHLSVVALGEMEQKAAVMSETFGLSLRLLRNEP